MRSLNKVMLIGHLAADVEHRKTKSDLSVANFPIATNYTVKEKNGEKRETVNFHRIVAWGKLADICNDYLAKVTAVYLDGRIVNLSYEEKDGARQFKTEIVAENINILTWQKGRSGEEEVGIAPISEEEIDDMAQDVEREKVAA